jgi:hypothetical protein
VTVCAGLPPLLRKSVLMSLKMPTDGTRAANDRSGDFGTSPF